MKQELILTIFSTKLYTLVGLDRFEFGIGF